MLLKLIENLFRSPEEEVAEAMRRVTMIQEHNDDSTNEPHETAAPDVTPDDILDSHVLSEQEYEWIMVRTDRFRNL